MTLILKWICIAIAVVCSVWLMIRLSISSKGGRVLFRSALLGLASLLIVSAIGKATNDTLFVNGYTLCTAAALGVPGVALMMSVKILWRL